MTSQGFVFATDQGQGAAVVTEKVFSGRSLGVERASGGERKRADDGLLSDRESLAARDRFGPWRDGRVLVHRIRDGAVPCTAGAGEHLDPGVGIDHLPRTRGGGNDAE